MTDSCLDLPVEDDRADRVAWPAVISLSLGVFGLVTAEFLPASLLPPIAHDLSISTGLAGQTVTATAVVGAIAGPAIVVGARKLDRRLVLLTLTSFLILSSLIAATASGFVPLLVARVLLGVALGGFWALSAAFAMRLAPGEHLPRAMSVIMAGVSVATVCAAPIGAWIGATLGWRAAFYLTAVLGVAVFLLQAFTVPAMPPAGHASFATMGRLLARRSVRTVFFVIILTAAGHFAGFTFIRSYLEDVIQLDVKTVSLVLLTFGVAGFFGNLAGGAISARTNAGAVAIAALMMAIAMGIVAATSSVPSLAIAGIAFWGFGFGAFPVAVQNRITRIASDEVESAGAIMLTTFQIAISSGAIIGGLLVEASGPIEVMAFAAVSSGLAAIIMLSARDRTSQTAQQGV